MVLSWNTCRSAFKSEPARQASTILINTSFQVLAGSEAQDCKCKEKRLCRFPSHVSCVSPQSAPACSATGRAKWPKLPQRTAALFADCHIPTDASREEICKCSALLHRTSMVWGWVCKELTSKHGCMDARISVSLHCLMRLRRCVKKLRNSALQLAVWPVRAVNAVCPSLPSGPLSA